MHTVDGLIAFSHMYITYIAQIYMNQPVPMLEMIFKRIFSQGKSRNQCLSQGEMWAFEIKNSAKSMQYSEYYSIGLRKNLFLLN